VKLLPQPPTRPPQIKEGFQLQREGKVVRGTGFLLGIWARAKEHKLAFQHLGEKKKTHRLETTMAHHPSRNTLSISSKSEEEKNGAPGGTLKRRELNVFYPSVYRTGGYVFWGRK